MQGKELHFITFLQLKVNGHAEYLKRIELC